jgi:hypothetical protein
MTPARPHGQGVQGCLASIAAMPKRLRPILLALIVVAVALFAAGCGDNSPDPSISGEDAATLQAKLEEIKANVDNGSCLVAADRTDDLISDIESLPPGVNDSVKNALLNGANNLKLLLVNPDKCQGNQTTTTAPTTTQETTTTEPTTTSQPTTTTKTTPTQTTPTQTTPTTPTGPGSTSGGVGPGGL